MRFFHVSFSLFPHLSFLFCFWLVDTAADGATAGGTDMSWLLNKTSEFLDTIDQVAADRLRAERRDKAKADAAPPATPQSQHHADAVTPGGDGDQPKVFLQKKKRKEQKRKKGKRKEECSSPVDILC